MALYTAFRRPAGQVLQQRRLADTGFAGHNQGAALAGADSFDEPVEHAALGVTINQLHHAPRTVRPAAICTGGGAHLTFVRQGINPEWS